MPRLNPAAQFHTLEIGCAGARLNATPANGVPSSSRTRSSRPSGQDRCSSHTLPQPMAPIAWPSYSHHLSASPRTTRPHAFCGPAARAPARMPHRCPPYSGVHSPPKLFQCHGALRAAALPPIDACLRRQAGRFSLGAARRGGLHRAATLLEQKQDLPAGPTHVSAAPQSEEFCFGRGSRAGNPDPARGRSTRPRA
eukprot:scaffold13912_cov108-Isochrysis_galbana.AAC.1